MRTALLQWQLHKHYISLTLTPLGQITALQHWGLYIPLFMGDMAATELDNTGDNICFAFLFHFNCILPLS
jgi:hypothetical protein